MAQRIRLHPEQLEQLKKEVAHSNDGTVDTRISLSDVVRAVIRRLEDRSVSPRVFKRACFSDGPLPCSGGYTGITEAARG